jgi:hypothetical protein
VTVSLEYIDVIGPEPDVSCYSDLHRWDRWMTWNRKFAKLFPGSNGEIGVDGMVKYDTVLQSQRTRQVREHRTPSPDRNAMRSNI